MTAELSFSERLAITVVAQTEPDSPEWTSMVDRTYLGATGFRVDHNGRVRPIPGCEQDYYKFMAKIIDLAPEVVGCLVEEQGLVDTGLIIEKSPRLRKIAGKE